MEVKTLRNTLQMTTVGNQQHRNAATSLQELVLLLAPNSLSNQLGPLLLPSLPSQMLQGAQQALLIATRAQEEARARLQAAHMASAQAQVRADDALRMLVLQSKYLNELANQATPSRPQPPNNEDKCPICLEPVELTAGAFNCPHKMCSPCWQDAGWRLRMCPVCRAPRSQ
jgi:hypothetical protein